MKKDQPKTKASSKGPSCKINKIRLSPLCKRAVLLALIKKMRNLIRDCPKCGIGVDEDKQVPSGRTGMEMSIDKLCDDREYRGSHGSSFRLSAQDRRAAPKATGSGRGTADPNKLDPAQGNTPNECLVIPEGEWKKFKTISWEQIAKLDVAILKQGQWIAPAARHNLNILCDGLLQCEGLWFDPNMPGLIPETVH